MFPKSFLIGAILLVSLSSVHAQKTQLAAQFFGGWDFSPTPPTNPLRDEIGNPLMAGTDAPDDGAIFQIGYFAAGPSPNWDSFVPISSTPGSNHLTTMGDEGGAPVDDANGMGGIFSVALTLDVNDPADAALLPPGYPAQLAIRFFNGTSVASSTHYNTVTSNAATWNLNPPATPPDVPASLNMDAGGLVWESGALGHYQTVLSTAPEPSTTLLVLLAGAIFLRRRR